MWVFHTKGQPTLAPRGYGEAVPTVAPLRDGGNLARHPLVLTRHGMEGLRDRWGKPDRMSRNPRKYCSTARWPPGKRERGAMRTKLPFNGKVRLGKSAQLMLC
ncbi:hypothetical protein MASR2M74_08170 [Paracoccaceae bacterium]